MSSAAVISARPGVAQSTLARFALGFWAIMWREIAKFLRQTERLISALVRPLLWLLVFAAGLHDLLGVSIIPPYRTYVPYQEYVIPGLIGIVILFQCMQSALSMVYDREAGVMRVMLVTPLPRSFLLFSKIAAATALSILQVYAFLLVARILGFGFPGFGWIFILPAVALVGLMLGSIGLLVTVYTPKIENFAGMMNFVVFPMFFLSAALYPLWKLRETGAYVIWYLANANPFTYAVELIRFAAYGKIDLLSLGVVVGCTIVAFLLAARGYDPQAGAIRTVKRA